MATWRGFSSSGLGIATFRTPFLKLALMFSARTMAGRAKAREKVPKMLICDVNGFTLFQACWIDIWMVFFH